MKPVIFIPARYASTRYPGKPLAELRQKDGSYKTLIQMSFEAACQIKGVDAVFVATDDDRISTAAKAFGADVIMTDPECENGTARCAQALKRCGLDVDLVINFQADAPLTPPWFVEDLMAAMSDDATIEVATPVLRCDKDTYDAFKEDRANGRVGGTTAVFDADMNALYFSKEVLPYIDPGKVPDPIPVYHHVGVYAYRPDALGAYINHPPSQIEGLEGLEQLRFLHMQKRLRCVEVDAKSRVFWELNNPTDVPRIETALKAMS